MWLGFFKECMVSLFYLGINLLSLAITFFWSHLKLWSASQQFLAISLLWHSCQRSLRNCDCDKNEIAKHCWQADHNFRWDQKKVIDRESRLIPRKTKKIIHSLKNPNHINFLHASWNMVAQFMVVLSLLIYVTSVDSN